MSSTLTFYIVRHGKTLLNTLEKVQGWCDSPLTEEGIEVTRHLGAGLNNVHIDSVYTSDLKRTRQTAEIILKEKKQEMLPITEVFGFREACFGGYESDYNYKMFKDASLFLQYREAEEMYKDVFKGKISNRDILNTISKLDHMGMAETYEQVENRSQQALFDIARKESSENKDKNILIVGHGMSIVCMLYGMGGKHLLKSHLENVSVCKVAYQNNSFQVLSMGDMSYVEHGKSLKVRV